MEEKEKKVEAVLFAVGREITAERISCLCALEQPEVESILSHLMEHYEQSGSSLKIIKKESGWKITVRDEFIPLVSSIVTSTELDKPLMETLAVIAWRYPVVQSEIIKLRSPTAYEHMHKLEEMGFIVKEKFGRTYRLKLTSKFFHYFDLPSEEAKKAFLKQVPPEVLQEAEEVNKQADEVERLIEIESKSHDSKEEIKKAMSELHQDISKENKQK